ncbi:MAG TPA: hypothetical protein VJR48_14375 [Ktedonobacterales bacterium]|nr:hypothetical protein [Ktedonobacterales bacterium]
MGTIETALWPPQQPTPLGEGVYIGLESDPRLTGLTEGERVLLLETNEVQVEAIVHKLLLNGRQVWFGEFQGEIQVIYSEDETTAAQSAPSKATK